MRKGMKRFFSVILVMILCMSGLAMSTQSTKVEAAVVSRDDGTWLFPLAKGYYNSFTDWAGCPGYSKCAFCGTTHNSWGDNDHTGQSYGHNGIDIGVPNGTNVLATAPGYVYYVNTNWNARGYTVVMEHAIGNGWSYYSIYQHLSKCNVVANGSYVNAGTVIAQSGNTGGSYTYGNHLHFGIVMGQSGLGASVADMGTGTLNSLERPGWITTSGYREGRILNNPASSNDAGFPSGNSAVVPPLKAHYGSVHYTFDTNKVTVGASATAALPGKPILEMPACDGRKTIFKWNLCDNTDTYSLEIYKENGELYTTYSGITTTQCEVIAAELPDGIYQAQIVAINGKGDTISDRVRITVTNNGAEDSIIEALDAIELNNGQIKVTVSVKGDLPASFYYALVYDPDKVEVAANDWNTSFINQLYQAGSMTSIGAYGDYISVSGTTTDGEDFTYDGEIAYAIFNKKTSDAGEVLLVRNSMDYSGDFSNAKNVGSTIVLNLNNISQEDVGNTETGVENNQEENIVTVGDVNNNDGIDLGDAQIALKAALKIMSLDTKQQQAADVDGQAGITLADAQKILKVALKILTSFDSLEDLTMAQLCQRVADYYNETYDTDIYVVFDDECQYTESGVQVILRHTAGNIANILVTSVDVEFSSGKITDEFGNVGYIS